MFIETLVSFLRLAMYFNTNFHYENNSACKNIFLVKTMGKTLNGSANVQIRFWSDMGKSIDVHYWRRNLFFKQTISLVESILCYDKTWTGSTEDCKFYRTMHCVSVLDNLQDLWQSKPSSTFNLSKRMHDSWAWKIFKKFRIKFWT